MNNQEETIPLYFIPVEDIDRCIQIKYFEDGFEACFRDVIEFSDSSTVADRCISVSVPDDSFDDGDFTTLLDSLQMIDDRLVEFLHEHDGDPLNLKLQVARKKENDRLYAIWFYRRRTEFKKLLVQQAQNSLCCSAMLHSLEQLLENAEKYQANMKPGIHKCIQNKVDHLRIRTDAIYSLSLRYTNWVKALVH